MFTCTNVYNQILTVRLCDAHEFEWRRHDPANSLTTYKYPGMDEFIVKGFIAGDVRTTPTNATQLEKGRQWIVTDIDWEPGSMNGLVPGDAVIVSSTLISSEDPNTYSVWVDYDDRMTWTEPDTINPVLLFNDRDVASGRIIFYK